MISKLVARYARQKTYTRLYKVIDCKDGCSLTRLYAMKSTLHLTQYNSGAFLLIVRNTILKYLIVIFLKCICADVHKIG